MPSAVDHEASHVYLELETSTGLRLLSKHSVRSRVEAAFRLGCMVATMRQRYPGMYASLNRRQFQGLQLIYCDKSSRLFMLNLDTYDWVKVRYSDEMQKKGAWVVS